MNPDDEISRGPTAEMLTVRSLVFDRVRRGLIRTAEFQRGLRWRSHDNVKLLDSVLKGYPIGSLLVWKRPAEKGSVKVGSAQIEVPERSDAWWVIDGQQRIMALAGALLDLPDQDKKLCTWYDISRRSLVAGDDPQLDEQASVPLSVLADPARFRVWTRQTSWSDEVLAHLDHVATRILDFTLLLYVVEAADEDVPREIFVRINTSGAHMTAAEVFHALPGGHAPRGGRIDLSQLGGVAADTGFGALEPSELLQVVLSAAGLDPTQRPENLPQEALPPQDEIGEALRRTLRFLMEDARVPLRRLLPYRVVISLLMRFFLLHPEPNELSRKRLVRWLWRGAVTGSHQWAEVSRVRATIAALDEDEEASIDRLLRHLSPRPTEPWRLRGFHQRMTHSRIELLALLDRRPLHLSGVPGGPFLPARDVTVAELATSDRLATEILAHPACEALPQGCRDLARTSANRILLHDRPTGLSVLLKPLDADRDAEFLRSHVIPPAALAALQAGDPATFLRERAAAVLRVIQAFVDREAAWDKPMIGSLQRYWRAG
jgi:hypothetical protein